MFKSILQQIVPGPVWTRLRLARLKRTLANYPVRQVEHTYGGYRLKLNLSDPLAEGWYNHDWPELPEIAFLGKHRLQPGATVFDLGAHQCVVALMLARKVGERGLVLAVEANAHNVSMGETNRRLNTAEQMRIIHAAVGDRRGKVVMNQSLNGQIDDGSGEWGRVEVNAVTIDDLAEEYGAPDVVFIDVEGFECCVLSGAVRTLKQQPDCFVEVHVGHGLEKLEGNLEKLLSYFPQTAYRLFMASDAHPDFVPFAPTEELTKDRFYLIALGRDGQRKLIRPSE